MSSPEKVFQYFASIQKDGQRFMTPRDFVRSITPFLGGDASANVSSSSDNLPAAFQRVVSVADPDGDGLISFAEYVFFTSLLSIPRKYFKTAFRLMDRNRDDSVDAEEFRKVLKVVQSRNPILQAARVSVDTLDSAVQLPGWFGADGSRTLTLEQFQSFLDDLHGAVREVYFENLDRDRDGFIGAREFALSLVNFASVKDLPRFGERVARLPASLDVRVSLREFADWKTVLESVDEIDEAMTFVAGRGEEFSVQQLKRVARAVTGIELKDEHLAVVLAVFDADGNGKLSSAEFWDVLRKAATMGLSKPRDFGLVRFASCCKDCVTKERV